MSLAMFSLKIEPGPRFEAFLIYFFNQSNVFGRMSFLINGFTTKKILPSSSPSPPSPVPPPSSYIPSKSSPPSWHEEEDFWALYNQTDLAISIATRPGTRLFNNWRLIEYLKEATRSARLGTRSVLGAAGKVEI